MANSSSFEEKSYSFVEDQNEVFKIIGPWYGAYTSGLPAMYKTKQYEKIKIIILGNAVSNFFTSQIKM